VSFTSTELEEVAMRIVVASDAHRRQITDKAVDRELGEGRRGRIAPATRGAVREWLGRFAGRDAESALERTTGWRFVVEAIERAGHRAHLADPAETAAKRGRRRRAKSDNSDCDLQLRLPLAGELPESWIPPARMLERERAASPALSAFDFRLSRIRLDVVKWSYGGAPARCGFFADSQACTSVNRHRVPFGLCRPPWFHCCRTDRTAAPERAGTRRSARKFDRWGQP
jgi:hypothetical protein